MPRWRPGARDYLRDFDKLLRKFHYRWTIFGHFGDGCVHCRITFDLKTPEGVRAYRSSWKKRRTWWCVTAARFPANTATGRRAPSCCRKMFGKEIVEAFREFKSIWDPQWKMNPGKVVDPYRLDQNLRVGPDYHPRPVRPILGFRTTMAASPPPRSAASASGKCRRLDGGTMCPSFKATREEMHSTRGRAHLLFEMMRGEVIADGWRDEHVKESLDLCLACKGCKSDCPVSVDMATYKAEFLAHYYEGRLRPRQAYAMG